MSQFSNIEKPTIRNAGGANRLLFVDVDNVINESLDDRGGYVSQAIQLDDGEEWLEIFPVKNSLNFEEAVSRGLANSMFSSTISGIIAKDEPGRIDQMERMERKRFIALMRNKNDEWIIVGTPDEPARFTYNKRTSGQKATERPQYEFRFSVSRRKAAPFLRTYAVFYWNNAGQLMFDNTFDPTLSASVDANGDLTISGPNAANYMESGGILYFIG